MTRADRDHGPIGCGKSTVARWMRERPGVVVIDADVVAREVLEPGEPALDAVIARFGPTCSAPTGHSTARRSVASCSPIRPRCATSRRSSIPRSGRGSSRPWMARRPTARMRSWWRRSGWSKAGWRPSATRSGWSSATLPIQRDAARRPRSHAGRRRPAHRGPGWTDRPGRAGGRPASSTPPGRKRRRARWSRTRWSRPSGRRGIQPRTDDPRAADAVRCDASPARTTSTVRFAPPRRVCRCDHPHGDRRLDRHRL